MFSPHSRLALAFSAALTLSTFLRSAVACDAGYMPCSVSLVPAPAPQLEAAPLESPQAKLSWVFKRSTYTNDPITGARVGQYARIEPVEPLDDQRAVTSSYRRMRSELRGRDGSMDTTYVVQGWGDGGGELNAQWHMFNDVWKEAILSGSFYNNQQAAGPWGSGRWGWNGGNGWNGNGWNNGPVWGGAPWGGGGWNGGNNWSHGNSRNQRSHWPSDNRAPLGGPNEPPASF
jgi:hypothetical protein